MIASLNSARMALIAVVFALAAPAAWSQRLNPSPRLRPNQTLFYRIDFTSSRRMKTESRVAAAQIPPIENISASALLQVEIVEARASGWLIRTYYSDRDAASPRSSAAVRESPDKMVEFSISPAGSVSQIKGLDQLTAAQQFAWHDWLGRFSSPMAFPKAGIRAHQKWESTEPETTPSPIASLLWSRKYEYVRDEPCTTPATSEVCAVTLVRAVLRQKSSPKNATPEDYRLRNLKTRGTASGHNETILYISRTTGLLVRSSEEAQQSMDAIVALADGSNEVHYNLDAKSHSEILLLPDSPAAAK